MNDNNNVSVEIHISKDLKELLQKHARNKGQSINNEILYRIKDSLQKEDCIPSFERMKCWIKQQKKT